MSQTSTLNLPYIPPFRNNTGTWKLRETASGVLISYKVAASGASVTALRYVSAMPFRTTELLSGSLYRESYYKTYTMAQLARMIDNFVN